VPSTLVDSSSTWDSEFVTSRCKMWPRTSSRFFVMAFFYLIDIVSLASIVRASEDTSRLSEIEWDEAYCVWLLPGCQHLFSVVFVLWCRHLEQSILWCHFRCGYTWETACVTSIYIGRTLYEKGHCLMTVKPIYYLVLRPMTPSRMLLLVVGCFYSDWGVYAALAKVTQGWVMSQLSV